MFYRSLVKCSLLPVQGAGGRNLLSTILPRPVFFFHSRVFVAAADAVGFPPILTGCLFMQTDVPPQRSVFFLSVCRFARLLR